MVTWCDEQTIRLKNKAAAYLELSLYKTLVRPNIRVLLASMVPHYIKDKVLLKRAQHRFTRMIPGLAKYGYPTRLKILGIEVFTIFTGSIGHTSKNL